jgi:hypothetical protein
MAALAVGLMVLAGAVGTYFTVASFERPAANQPAIPTPVPHSPAVSPAPSSSVARSVTIPLTPSPTVRPSATG